MLEKALKLKNIQIQVFINSIFNDLVNLILNSGDMKTAQSREDFENKVNYIVNKALENYTENLDKYQKVIEAINTKNLLKNYIILESSKLISEAEIEYPYYYEFLSIPIVSENQLDDILKSIKDAEKLYPTLCNYLRTNKKDIEYLKYFSQINNFVNYTIENYTNEISREKAKSKKISEEIYTNNNNENEINRRIIPENLFKEFLKGFNKSEIYKVVDHYNCHNLKEHLELRELTKDDFLSSFLIDNGMVDYGMQIAAIYQKYISIQNTFLDNVLGNINTNNQKLDYLKTKINEEVDPQKANTFNVLSFDISSENYESFLEMLLFYSYKDSFDEKGNFDFSKKDKIKYNLEEIEDQLENLLLQGKKKFTNKIEFVIYQFEGFRQKSSILSEFMMNYPQNLLDEDQKKSLYNFRNEQYSTDSLIRILFSIQLMITFYNEQPTYDNKNIRINETFSDFPSFFRIPEDTRNLFKNNSFTISHILSVYEYFELLCFDEFKKNIDPSFKQIINDEKKNNIEKYFEKNQNAVLNKLEISSAVRKFISRNLAGTREDLNVDRNQELFFILQCKEDCWNAQIINNASFEEEIEQLKKLNIKVAEILNLYEKLGGDKVLLGENNKNKVNVEEPIDLPVKKRPKKINKKIVF